MSATPCRRYGAAWPYVTPVRAPLAFVAAERAAYTVFPPQEDVFNALRLVAPAQVRVLLLGQDPYHDDGHAHGLAHGLAFSVRPGSKTPPSLANIFRSPTSSARQHLPLANMFAERKSDLGCHIPNNGYLMPWAEQGVLLLNAVLTVRAHHPNSHKNHGWERFSDGRHPRRQSPARAGRLRVVWGGYAQKKAPLVDTSRHVIVQSAHPSPLSARTGFFGSQPFSKINAALRSTGAPEIHWQLPDL